MSKSSMVMLGLFVALGVGYFAMQDSPKEAEFPPISVQGFVSKDVSLQDVKILNKDDDSPYTRWEVTRTGETYTMQRLPGQEGKKHSEARWEATRTYDGGKRKVVVKGEPYRVRMYSHALARSFRSSYAFKAGEKELAEYGLDAANRVELKATGGGKTVHLFVGKVDGGAKDPGDNAINAKTWVMRPDVKDVVYQVAGVDLRANIDVDWKDVRDRKLLDIEVARIDKVVLENPADPLSAKVVATREKLPPDQEKKLTEIKTADKDTKTKLEKELRKSNDGWTIREPKGYEAGEFGGWIESIERMSLTEVIDTPDGKAPAGSGLDDAKTVRHVTLFWGDKKAGFRIGATKEGTGEKEVWVAVDSDKESVYRVASWSAEQIDKMLDDVRDTKLFGKGNKETVQAAENLVVDSPDGRFSARLEDGKWIARGVRADHKKIKDFVDDLAGLDVDYESGKSRTEVGIDKPEWRIALSAKGRQFNVALAAKKGEDYFGAVGDAGHVFKLQSWNADRVRKASKDLKDKHLVLDLTAAAIDSITVPNGDKTARLQRIKEGGWSLSPADPVAKLKTAAIDGLATALAAATYDTDMSDKPLAELGLDKPEHTVAFTAGKDRYELRISKEVKDGNPYIAVYSGKKPLVIATMQSFSLDSLKKSLFDLRE